MAKNNQKKQKAERNKIYADKFKKRTNSRFRPRKPNETQPAASK